MLFNLIIFLGFIVIAYFILKGAKKLYKGVDLKEKLEDIEHENEMAESAFGVNEEDVKFNKEHIENIKNL